MLRQRCVLLLLGLIACGDAVVPHDAADAGTNYDRTSEEDSEGSTENGPDGRRASNQSVNPFQNFCGNTSACIPGDDSDCKWPITNPPSTCQLSARGAAECVASGSVAEGSPCESSDDCKGGMHCVTDGGTAVCRRYCCSAPEGCKQDRYCDLRFSSGTLSQQVPVCAATSACNPLDDASCPGDQKCAIVRDDGTTSCVDEGWLKLSPESSGEAALGSACDPCPCDSGFVCSQLTQTCKKLCYLGDDEKECPGGGICQSGSAVIPEGFGICVGGNADACY